MLSLYRHARKVWILFVIIMLSMTDIAFARTEFNTLIFNHIFTLASAEGPRIIADHLFLSYTSALRVPRAVSVAFGHHNYAILHHFEYNRHGVYFIAIPLSSLYDDLPHQENHVEYRLIVDGIWMSDPHNPENIRDDTGLPISTFLLPSERKIIQYPLQNGNAINFIFAPQEEGLFLLSNNRGQRVAINYFTPISVYIAGSFNGWDPYMYPLQQIDSPIAGDPPIFRGTLTLPRGTHYYYYVINGDRILDPHNERTAITSDGRRASILVVQ